jgi:hypothetical protein
MKLFNAPEARLIYPNKRTFPSPVGHGELVPTTVVSNRSNEHADSDDRGSEVLPRPNCSPDLDDARGRWSVVL